MVYETGIPERPKPTQADVSPLKDTKQPTATPAKHGQAQRETAGASQETRSRPSYDEMFNQHLLAFESGLQESATKKERGHILRPSVSPSPLAAPAKRKLRKELADVADTTDDDDDNNGTKDEKQRADKALEDALLGETGNEIRARAGKTPAKAKGPPAKKQKGSL